MQRNDPLLRQVMRSHRHDADPIFRKAKAEERKAASTRQSLTEVVWGPMGEHVKETMTVEGLQKISHVISYTAPPFPDDLASAFAWANRAPSGMFSEFDRRRNKCDRAVDFIEKFREQVKASQS